MEMEVIGILAAVIGLTAAILNRKRIVVHRHEAFTASPPGHSKAPTSLGKRFKRLLICVVAVSVFAMISGSVDPSNEELTYILAWPILFFMLAGMYQFVAILIIVFARMWR